MFTRVAGINLMRWTRLWIIGESPLFIKIEIKNGVKYKIEHETQHANKILSNLISSEFQSKLSADAISPLDMFFRHILLFQESYWTLNKVKMTHFEMTH